MGPSDGGAGGNWRGPGLPELQSCHSYAAGVDHAHKFWKNVRESSAGLVTDDLERECLKVSYVGHITDHQRPNCVFRSNEENIGYPTGAQSVP